MYVIRRYFDEPRKWLTFLFLASPNTLLRVGTSYYACLVDMLSSREYVVPEGMSIILELDVAV
ncbi:hypothetical protein Krac_3029 [Ktedonobacter racemifer DSM 44963]|uniref:Uncharacterized protein n=1 Tax=Ktedonobacter racemifer DSM 44963 TaxID=485913 RepID=D6U099_KTERA|nr:hypothetical protein Krac_3029 [Ktedonobacter racemifer DSM 44963]